ncbi:polyhydroxyalkanoic acid system family protein [Variovorax rhizosphaerae]|uniref:Polyhydroxyalkanoic acid system family protein n=1 Tax=Variovorax rhizosphaerae TaxID=1836200 RepID=A0ABU8WEZ9_9BURK
MPLQPLAQCGNSLHSMHMAAPIIISIPHQLGRAEARRRIEGGFSKIINVLPVSSGALSERWDGDRLIFSVEALGQAIAGVIQVLDATVTIEIELPGVLRVIAGGLKDRLQKMGQLLLTKK